MTTLLNPAEYDALACTDPNAPITTESDPYAFAVIGPRDTYYLSVLANTCTCQDCVFNRHTCKHLRHIQEIVSATIQRKECRAEATYPQEAAQLRTEAHGLRVNLAAVKRLYGGQYGQGNGQRLEVSA